jgi:hypothetical protein
MVHYLKNPKGGRPIAVDYRTGKIKEEHESWYDPQKPPETEPPEKWMPPIPGYEHPPKYLVPKGNGFYGDPNEAADPQDCDGPLGEISPWCGGNPFSIKPFDLDPEVKWDECNVWARINPVVGFVKIRPITLSYRLPGECRNEPPIPPPTTPKPGKVIVNYPKNIDPNLAVYAFVSYSGTYYPMNDSIKAYRARWDSYRCPGDPESRNGVNYFPPVTGFANFSNISGKPVEAGLISPNQGYSSTYRGTYIALGMTPDGKVAYEDLYSPYSRRTYIPNAVILARIGLFNVTWAYADIGIRTLEIYEGRYGSIIDYLHLSRVGEDLIKVVNVDFVIRQNCSTPFEKDKIPPPPKEPKKDCCMDCSQQNELLRQILAETRKAREEAEQANLKATQASKDALEAKQEAEKISRNIGEFPVNVTIFDADENSQEAQSQVLQIRSLSQGISRSIERVEKVAKIIGIDALPLTVPVSVVEPVDQNMIDVVFDFFTPDTKQIHNLFEFLAWMVEQDNAVLGKWQQKITIEDTNAAEEGNQKKDIAIVDLSHAIREIIMQELQNYKLIGLMVDMTFKLLVECASTKQEVAKILAQLDELIQWTGMGTRTKALDCPIQITPLSQEVDQPYPENATDSQKAEIDKNNERNKADANNLHKWLQPSHTKITYQNWDGHDSLTEQFIHLATLLRKQ